MEAHGVTKKDLFSHYDFRKSVAMDWINKKQQTGKRNLILMMNGELDNKSVEDEQSSNKKRHKSGSDVESAEKRSSTRLKEKEKEVEVTARLVRVLDASLLPDGALKNWLRRDLFHWPKQAKPNQQCTIHQWASNVELKDKVMRCTDCNVHLCVNCYQLFHMVPNIVDKKKQMEKVFLQQQK
jgi:HSP90 family molecular chaperone